MTHYPLELRHTCTGDCGAAPVSLPGGVCLTCLDSHDPNIPHVQRESCTDLCQIILEAVQLGSALYLSTTWIPDLGESHMHRRYYVKPSFECGTLTEYSGWMHTAEECYLGCPLNSIRH